MRRACLLAPRRRGPVFAFHFHGFADLAGYAGTDGHAEHDSFWARVIASWLDREGQPSMPGCQPFPMSWGIATWCSALSREGWPVAIRQRMLRSLIQQAAVLVRSTRQSLADGGHEERSTAYHRAVLCDLAGVGALLERASRPGLDWLVSARGLMTTWERVMRGPDGRNALLNDAWKEPPELAHRSQDLITVLRSSDYVVLCHEADQAVFEVGPVAPPHLPPHAHADSLSFVLWADGYLLITGPGSFAYSGPERRRFRSTASHNTLEVDGQDQCELWGDFPRGLHPPSTSGRSRRTAMRTWSSAATTAIDALPIRSTICGPSADLLLAARGRADHCRRTAMRAASSGA